MTERLCLFAGPYAFFPELEGRYQAVMPTLFRSVCTREELFHDPRVVAWVTHTGQTFVVDDAALDCFPNLTCVLTSSTGNNHLDLAALKRRGIAFYSLLDDRAGLENIAASAEFTFLLLLNALKGLDSAVREVDAGRWRENEEAMRGHELQDRRVGLVGLGRIGRRMLRYCSAFGARVTYFDPYVDDPGVARATSLEGLVDASDAVVICCSLTAETRGLFGEDLLRRLRPGAALVNSARGEIVDEGALAKVMEARADLRVGIDVMAGEVTGTQFQSALIPLQRAGRITITPHIAGATEESQAKAALVVLGLLQRHFRP